MPFSWITCEMVASSKSRVDSSKTVPIGMPTTFPYSSGVPIWKMTSAKSPMVELALDRDQGDFRALLLRALGERQHGLGLAGAGEDQEQVAFADARGDDLADDEHVITGMHQAHGEELRDQAGTARAGDEDAPAAVGLFDQRHQLLVVAVVGRCEDAR